MSLICAKRCVDLINISKVIDAYKIQINVARLMALAIFN